jgi:Zn-dependent protease
LANIVQNFNWTTLLNMLIALIAALICIIIHEMSHGFVAGLLGDKTAKEMGRLSLNPLKHIDPIGLLAFVIIGFGWAKPVMINPKNFKNPKRGMAISSLAGPVSNFIIAVVFMFIMGLIAPYSTQKSFFFLLVSRIVTFSLVLGIFNLVPIPPLDGSKVLYSIASDELWQKLMMYERYGFILLLVLVMIPATSNLLLKATQAVFEWLLPIANFAVHLTGH